MDVRESVVLIALTGLAFAIFACAAFVVVRRLRAAFAARCRFVGFWILLVGIGLTVRVCATKPVAGIAAAPPMSSPDAPSAVQDGGASVTNLRITACAVTTNGIDLALAWPSSLFPDGACLDLFAKVGALDGDWIWLDCLTVASAATNASFFVRYADLTAATNAPSAAFFRVGDRATSASTMRDQDGDGLPDVYELHNGTNPYVADFESAPKLTVGPDGDFSTISAAFAASTNYSVIALSAHPESSDGMIVMPSHPVMVTGPEDGYAVLHSSANIVAFLMDAGQGDETLLRNLYVVLEARDGFQSAFWVGGNLPWSGAGASPAFENVRVRALYPNVLHYGWHYYCDNGGFSSLSNCVMNAAGSSSAVGIYAYDGPGVGMSDCVFVNFPTDGGSCATWIRSGTNIVAETVSGSANRSWAGCPLDVLYGNDDDSDADGLSDYGEVHAYDTDPWLSDSDGDGLSDSEEISAGTDPCDLYSFYRRVTVVTTAADNLAEVTNYVAWGTSREGWETNGISAWQTLPSTNVYEVMSASGPMYVKAYRDLNRNGEYDADTDIILVEQVPPLDAVTSFTFRFGDVDGDGVADDVERLDGSDPYDGKSFRLRAVVSCADTDRSVPVTNHLGVAGEFHDADVAFAESGTLTVDAIVTNGACVVNCWRDFNGNGEYDDGVDVLCSRTLTKTDNGKTVLMSVGDADGDGQSDSSELAHGTDPHDAKIYCFKLAFVEDEVFSTTNRLSAEVLFGADVLVGPVVMSNRSWECDLGHLTASNRETIVAYFWDDANSNGVRDAYECSTQQRFSVKGHENVLTNTLSRGAFDRDSDGMLDYWEMLHADAGLSPTNAADAFLDFDSDGLINLHEFWADCAPSVPDGSNTLLSVLSRSVDGRLVNADPSLCKEKFLHYTENAAMGVYVSNTNFWLKNVDTTCASPWQNLNAGYQWTVTLVTPRHVISASHHTHWVGCTHAFVGKSGRVYYRQVIEQRHIDTPINTDICIGELNESLPTNDVMPVCFMPVDIVDYIASGRGLPMVAFDQEEKAVVHEVLSISLNSVAGQVPRVGMRNAFYEAVVSGDSSNPRFFLLNDRLVLLNVFWHGGAGDGTFVSAFGELIQCAIDSESPDEGFRVNYIGIEQYEKLP